MLQMVNFKIDDMTLADVDQWEEGLRNMSAGFGGRTDLKWKWREIYVLAELFREAGWECYTLALRAENTLIGMAAVLAELPCRLPRDYVLDDCTPRDVSPRVERMVHDGLWYISKSPAASEIESRAHLSFEVGEEIDALFDEQREEQGSSGREDTNDGENQVVQR